MQHIHAEIAYATPETSVHSDLCAEGEDVLTSTHWREILHTALDEWLNKSTGTGIFYVGDLDLVQYDKE